MRSRHIEQHRSQYKGWLRAAVLGANDGIVSTASLLLGVVAAGASARAILIAGVASLVAGAMSMAAGEFVSVSTQADTERADLEREGQELASDPDHELAEMTAIYLERGLDTELAAQVASQLMRHDALGAHARDELGIFGPFTARPLQAALASAASFATGAALPLVIILLAPQTAYTWIIPGSALLCLAALGVLSAWIGRAPLFRATLRLLGWGALAMALTSGVGAVLGGGAA